MSSKKKKLCVFFVELSRIHKPYDKTAKVDRWDFVRLFYVSIIIFTVYDVLRYCNTFHSVITLTGLILHILIYTKKKKNNTNNNYAIDIGRILCKSVVVFLLIATYIYRYLGTNDTIIGEYHILVAYSSVFVRPCAHTIARDYNPVVGTQSRRWQRVTRVWDQFRTRLRI